MSKNARFRSLPQKLSAAISKRAHTYIITHNITDHYQETIMQIFNDDHYLLSYKSRQGLTSLIAFYGLVLC